jgi:hypothetical protein
MANEHLNLRDRLEGDEQYEAALGRMAQVVAARRAIVRANPYARDVDALFVTGVLDLDGVASFEVLDADQNTRAGFNYETDKITSEARAYMLALSKWIGCDGQLADDFGAPSAKWVRAKSQDDLVPVYRLRAVED